METSNDSLTQTGTAVTLFAKVDTLGSFDAAHLAFDLREYPGFALSSYETGWQRLPEQTVSAPGTYSYTLEGLKPGVTYQYRAVLFNESNTMRGEMNLFVKD